MEDSLTELEISASSDACQEGQTIRKLEEEHLPLELGASRYLVRSRWFEAWSKHTGYQNASSGGGLRPGPISNDLLIAREDSGELRPGLQEGLDFQLVCEPAWRALQGLYGGGPAIARTVIRDKESLRVEVYPLQLTALRSSAPDQELPIQLSIVATVADLKVAACAAHKLEEVDVQLWDYYQGAYYGDEPLDAKSDTTLGQAQVLDKQFIMLLEKDDEGNFPEVKRRGSAGFTTQPLALGSPPLLMGPSPTAASTFGTFGPTMRSSYATDTTYPAEGRPMGLAGLGNLGNTCFMNSSLQCLSHAPPLVRMFLSGEYRRDLNRDNPLGNKGELAEAFGHLLELLWQGGVASVAPKGFKAALARFAPQFQGYAQQDAQELLAFLLDGLHEDLNRVRVKPYAPEADAAGRPDKALAAEAWANYRKRNDSVVVDHFQGLYKSTLVCPDCGFRSVKFDPFMYLSLPLPAPRTRTLLVTLVRLDGARLPTTHAVEVPKSGTIADVHQALAPAAGLLPAGGEEGADPGARLLLAELAPHAAPRTFPDGATRVAELAEGGNATLLAYVYPSAEAGPRSGKRESHVFHRRRQRKRGSSSASGAGEHACFAAPLVLFLPEAEAHALKHAAVPVDQWGTEYLVAGRSSLDDILESALRPFKRARLDDNGDCEPAGNGAVAGSHDASSSDMGAPTEDDGASQAAGQALPNAFGAASALPAFGHPATLRAADVDAGSRASSARALHGSFEMLDVPTVESGTTSPMHTSAAGGMDNDWAAILGDRTGTCAREGTLGVVEGAPGDEGSPPPGAPPAPHSSAAGWADEGASERRSLAVPASTAAQDEPDGWGNGTEAQGDGWPATSWPTYESGWASGEAQLQALPVEQNGNGPGYVDAAAGGAQQEDGAMPDQAPLARTGGEGALAASGAISITPQMTPCTSPQTSPMGSPLASCLPEVKPFDMWAGQAEQAEPEEEAEEEGTPALPAGGARPGAPWVLKRANSVGATRLYAEPGSQGDMSGRLYFAVDWSAEGGALYDVAGIDRPLRTPEAQAAIEAAAHRPADPTFTLAQCLEAFLQPERLDASETWYCGRCKAHVRAEKKLDLWSAPELLVVHLKRFSYSRSRRDKLDAAVDFPLAGLDLAPYMLREQDVPPTYDLFAVSNHFGGLGGGHYTAYCRLGDGGGDGGASWHCFDDSHVSPVSAEAVHSPAAYVLFYRRRHEAERDPGCLAGLPACADPDTEMAEAPGLGGPDSGQPAGGSGQLGPPEGGGAAHVLAAHAPADETVDIFACDTDAASAPSLAGDAADEGAGNAAGLPHGTSNGGAPSTQGDGSYVFVSDGASSKDEADLYSDGGGDAPGLAPRPLLPQPAGAGEADQDSDKENAHKAGKSRFAHERGFSAAARSLFDDAS